MEADKNLTNKNAPERGIFILQQRLNRVFKLHCAFDLLNPKPRVQFDKDDR